jgi:D-alanyl-lipoteichoic acid acyltransferase DltB (MBOAT superfamily)
MNFASIEFWITLAGLFLILQLVRPFFKAAEALYDQVALLVLSLGLLFSESLLTGLIFLYITILSFLGIQVFGGRAGNPGSRSGPVLLFVAMLAPLCYFKYSGFLVNSMGGVSGLAWTGLIPMGISFYTFQAVGMVVDQRKGGGERPSFLTSLNFLSFFPQIVAGPIERSKALVPQIERFVFKIRWDRLESATCWVVFGLFFKLVLADNIAAVLATLRDSGADPLEVLLRTAGVGFRIYFDFAGYSFVALGLASLLGVDLSMNFRSPYLATSIQDFWRRWHISLSTWIRDYLYIPLGGGRTRRWPLVVILVFIVSGAWHGAGWNFLLWGAIHGVALVIWRLFDKWIPGGFAGWILTQGLVFLAWLPFFTPDLGRFSDSMKTVLSVGGYSGMSFGSIVGLFDSRGDFLVYLTLLAAGAAIIFLEFLSKRGKNGEDYSLFRKKGVCLVMVFLIVVFGSTSEGDFVYFNF